MVNLQSMKGRMKLWWLRYKWGDTNIWGRPIPYMPKFIWPKYWRDKV